MRWLVERAQPCEAGQFEDVGAESVYVASGALVFHTGTRIDHILSPGQWVAVTPEDDL